VGEAAALQQEASALQRDPAAIAVGFGVAALAVVRRRASVAGLLVIEIGLLAIILLHLYSPKGKAPPVRTELVFFFYS
jgi:hypothetical protein